MEAGEAGAGDEVVEAVAEFVEEWPKEVVGDWSGFWGGEFRKVGEEGGAGVEAVGGGCVALGWGLA